MTIKNQIKSDFLGVLKDLKFVQNNVILTRPKDKKNGDYSTNWALQQAKLKTGDIKQSPEETAKKIVENFPKKVYLEKIEIASPGFINFFLTEKSWQKKVGEIVAGKENFVSSKIGEKKKARVEFVSANPTGPLHIGNARGGPLGDTLANVLTACGYEVLREYLQNDVGGQVEKLGQTIINVVKGKSIEDQEYKGEYIKELASKLKEVEIPQEAGKKAVEMMLEEAMSVCKKMGISFDKIYKESEFIENGQTKDAISELEKKGLLKKNEGAVWFAPGDEYLKDREAVVVKSDGSYTYFANDIGYHKLKFSQGYDLIIDELGSGHDGHIPKLQAAMSAYGFNISKFAVIVHQYVRVKRGDEVLKMSKRAGNIVTAEEVLDEVGKDAFRFLLLMHDPSTHMDFDLELAKEKSEKNPVYYVQYAHARISSILGKAVDSQISAGVNYSLLNSPYEQDLIYKLTELPELIEEIASDFGVHKLSFYAMSLADSFHRFYENCKVISEDKELTAARLQLVLATGIILRENLKLLGITAPEKM